MLTLVLSKLVMNNPNHSQPATATPVLTPFERVRSCYYPTLFGDNYPTLFGDRNERPLDPRDATAFRLYHSRFEAILEAEAKAHGFFKSGFVRKYFLNCLVADTGELVAPLIASTCEALDRLHADIEREDEMRAFDLEQAQRVLVEQFKGREGVNGFVSFYHSEQEEYSPAEGGCWFVRRTPRACYPARQFWNDETQALDRTLLEAEADRLGLTLEGSMVSRSDGTLRPVRKICSSAAEADCEAFLETYPFQSAKTLRPQYE